MLRFLSTVLAVVLGMFLFVFLLVMAASAMLSSGDSKKKVMPHTIVLELDLRQKIEDAPSSGMHGFGGADLSVVGIVDALQKASTDPKVKGLLIRSDSSFGVAPGQIQEIRSAIADFKKSGKFAITHIQDLTEPGIGGYYLASVGTEVWMQPSGGINSQGLGTSDLFFKGTLDKLDSSAQVMHYYEYKTAMHSFIYDDYTAPQKEEDLRLMQGVFDSFSGEIAAARGVKPEDFKAKLSAAPFLGQEAVTAGLVDKLGFAADAEDAAKAKAGAGAETVSLEDYYERAGSAYTKGAVIALIEGDGMIIEGKEEHRFFGSSGMMASDTISEALNDAADDKSVKAIIFRVNSPGGSATASDQIWNAVARAQKKGKPVIIDMAGVAASGGYWVSMGADRIIAEPTTISGSIGVVGGKFILKGVYDKLGINVRELTVGGDKMHMFSDQHAFTPEEYEALRRTFDTVYGQFTEKVASGRHLPLDKVRDIAKGRVWIGADAKDRGLVDELGGLKESIAAAKRFAKLEPHAAVQLKHFPEHKSFFETLFGAMGASAEAARSLSVISDVLQLGPSAKVIDELKREETFEHDRVQAIADPISIH